MSGNSWGNGVCYRCGQPGMAAITHICPPVSSSPVIPPAVPQGAEEPKRPTEPFHGNFEMALPGTAAYVQELREYAAALRVRCDQQERAALIATQRVMRWEQRWQWVLDGERIDRDMGYPIKGDSALAVALSGVDEDIAREATLHGSFAEWMKRSGAALSLVEAEGGKG